jgi:eukaryotic-like serine/threonine-protein kinase
MTMPASPSTHPAQAATPVNQVVPTATELALPRKPLVGRPTETTLPTQVGQQAGVMPTEMPVTLSAAKGLAQRGISRRTVVLGLAGLAVVGVAGGGLIWLARSQQSVGTTLYTYHGHSNIVRAVAWNPVGGQVMPNGRRIASASNDWTVQVWDAVDGGNVFTYRGHSAVVDAVAWAPHGRRIASGSYDNTVQVWNAADGGNVLTYRGHASVVNAVAWSPDGRRIASGSADKTVQVWDATDGGNVFTYRGHSNDVLAVAWSPNGKRIASGGGNFLAGTVQVWDAVGGDSVAVDGGNVYTYHGHSGAVLAVAWSPDGKDIASGSRDKTVQVWVAG